MPTSGQETAKSIILGELRKRTSVIVSMVVFLILTIHPQCCFAAAV